MHPRTHTRHLLLAAALLAPASPVVAGALRVTIERAGIQVSQLHPLLLTTETFDSAAAGAAASIGTAVGTLGTSGGGQAIAPNNATGGAEQPGGLAAGAHFLRIGPDAQSTLDLATAAGGPGPVGYFGFWWSAADAGNTLVVNMLDGDAALLDHQALLGAGAYTGAHQGNPTGAFAGHNPGQPYAYVNLYAASPDSLISSVVFRQAPGSDAFELDNLSVAAGLIAAAPTGPADVPAPGTLLLLAPTLALLARRPRVRRLQSASRVRRLQSASRAGGLQSAVGPGSAAPGLPAAPHEAVMTPQAPAHRPITHP